MQLSEIRKALAAAALAIGTVGPQALMFGDILPPKVSLIISIAVGIAGIYAVWALPNGTTTSKLVRTMQQAQELIPMFRDIAREEVVRTASVSPSVQVHVREPEIQPDPLPPADPFVVPPLGR
ncbi:hypothetical protein [Rhodococcus rhodochrous]|uniref:hypothetical protein n=1 Tax=Rhodococcus rhodochrous TaxID=1829 RepID=UPI001E5D9DB5|nr:hypothetical protein [Rhodococcus rhodochrous]MCD2096525.1 hypothetical protein [Rhodococcus rhodochrous]MCD2121257.1 hypothetical protein [Rhodococcus rhodochrous]MCQ4137351.1 hypothetical protein [Rhodococcus rhodochrous]MDJ0021156.1 hypothetical protein [Rhodococcus rhodochrous]